MQFRVIPAIISFAMFIEAVDATIINTAIPAMSLSLNVDPINLKIALISYLLSLAIFIPISGWLADKVGIKRIFIIGLSIFTISSFFCGIANNLFSLVICRIFQGIGGSIMMPIGRLIIVRTYEKHEWISITNQVVMIGALGIMLGPTLGGIITHYLSWRWIFFVNIPFGLLSISLALYWLKEIKSDNALHELDKIGFLLFGAGLAFLTFGLSAISESNIKHSVTIAILLLSILFFLLYSIYSHKKIHPVVNMKLFYIRTFRVSALGNLISRIGFGGIPFLIPLLLQIGFGYSAQLSGLLLAPTAIGILVAKPLAIYILRLLNYKRFLIVNTILMSMTLCCLVFITSKTYFFIIIIFTFLFGFFSTLQYSGMNPIAYIHLKPQDLSGATSIISTLQQLSQSFGVAISAIFIQFFSRNNVGKNIITVHSLHQTFLAMGILTLLSILIFTQLNAEDGEELLRKNKGTDQLI